MNKRNQRKGQVYFIILVAVVLFGGVLIAGVTPGIGASINASPHPQFTPVTAGRMPGFINTAGIPANTPEAWVKIQWLVSRSPEGCGVNIAEADTVTPLAAFDCHGEYLLNVRYSRGLTLDDGTERTFGNEENFGVDVLVLAREATDEELFGDWTDPDWGVAGPVTLRHGEFEE